MGLSTPDQEKIDRIRKELGGSPGGLTITELSSRLRMNRNLAAKLLDLLSISGQATIQVTGTAKVYSLSQRVPVFAVLDGLSDGIMILDRDMVVVHANEKILAMLREKRENILGMRIGETSFPPRAGIPPESLRRDLASQRTIIIETNGMDRGTACRFRIRYIPTVFDDGSPGTILVVEKNGTSVSRQVSGVSFLRRKSGEFIDLPAGADIYGAVGRGVRELLPGATVAVSSFDPATGAFTIRSFLTDRELEIAADQPDRRMVGQVIQGPARGEPGTAHGDLTAGKIFPLPAAYLAALSGRIPAGIAGIGGGVSPGGLTFLKPMRCWQHWH
jgi:PAS domain-containing protein